MTREYCAGEGVGKNCYVPRSNYVFPNMPTTLLAFMC